MPTANRIPEAAGSELPAGVVKVSADTKNARASFKNGELLEASMVADGMNGVHCGHSVRVYWGGHGDLGIGHVYGIDRGQGIVWIRKETSCKKSSSA
jgi:hypothetical protein